MSEERKQILQMLSQGTITADEAERLLEKLEGAGRAPGSVASEASETDEGTDRAGSAPRSASSGQLKFLRVVVDSSDGDHINIRVPMALVRTGLKLSTMLPRDAQERLDEKGIDLSQLSALEGEELIESLRELNVDVDTGDGDVVRVFCE